MSLSIRSGKWATARFWENGVGQAVGLSGPGEQKTGDSAVVENGVGQVVSLSEAGEQKIGDSAIFGETGQGKRFGSLGW